MDIYLVRHGEAAATWGEAPDPGLSELGAQQAERAAQYLYPRIDDDTRLISSPLVRALETAAPLARMTGRAVDQEDVFREIPSPVPLAERQAWLKNFMQQQWHEQGEALLHWRVAALQRLLQLDSPLVVFTHFLVINAVVGQVLQQQDTLCFWPDNGSVTQLRNTNDQLELVTLGDEIKTMVN